VLYRIIFKRLVDFVTATILFVIFLPVFIILTLALFIANNGKPFFYHARPGKDARPIRVIKFKSMNDKVDETGTLLPDLKRMTKIGNFIRVTSLDELPQLLNVIVGDMSLIGPRPLLFKYLPLYSENQKKRHSVRPGITGWAQVNGRNSISWSEKFKHDVYYVENLSFKLDLKIVWLTIVKVLQREGINQSKERPMLPFDGTN
jgi:lipopolysaccharide/colanic/teichoic acid biosynthesis glycosyltransferase